MALDQEFILKGLLQHNYLPTMRDTQEEMPPIFSSTTFTPQVASALKNAEFGSAKDERRKRGYDQIEYRLTRYNSISRPISIPHPTPHARLCLALYENWEKLEYITSNPNSQIKPREHKDGRLIIMSGYGGVIGNSKRQLNYSFAKRYRVKTDISNCFHSIYSHAVAWGLVGRDEAKQKRDDHQAWFNKIDKCIRSSRRQETQGIAIGPGTSNVVAEIILARIDEQLREKCKSFVRYIDDYEFYCDTEGQAKELIQLLERAASEFKLQLNIQKTEISKLPQPVSENWILQLGQHAPKGDNTSTFDVYRFLDVALSLASANPGANVLKYAASVIQGLKLNYSNSIDCLEYFFSLSFHHTDLLPKLQELIDSSYLNFGEQFFDLEGTQVKLNALLRECAILRRSDGMCWSLYYLGRVNQSASPDVAKKVIDTEDSLAILTLYWSHDEHKKSVVDFALSLDLNDIHELDRHWMLLYQLYLDGHVGNPYKYDKCFAILKDAGVSFLLNRQDVAPKVEEAGAEFQ